MALAGRGSVWPLPPVRASSWCVRVTIGSASKRTSHRKDRLALPTEIAKRCACGNGPRNRLANAQGGVFDRAAGSRICDVSFRVLPEFPFVAELAF